jgi:hypothetical protein
VGSYGCPKAQRHHSVRCVPFPLVEGLQILRSTHSTTLHHYMPQLQTQLSVSVCSLHHVRFDAVRLPNRGTTTTSHVTVPAICVPRCIQWIPLPRCEAARSQFALCGPSVRRRYARAYPGCVRKVTDVGFTALFVPLVGPRSQATRCIPGQKRKITTTTQSRRMSTRSRVVESTTDTDRPSLVYSSCVW